jgi:hypothetical protein
MGIFKKPLQNALMNTFQKKRTDGDNGPSFLLQGGNEE